ncbi:MAG: trypsin-like peptidase domain-containing protein [Planctomycetota bacterium]|nr:trypsin-like peptidase domain-containing protein [Planctomycetota bacterium]
MRRSAKCQVDKVLRATLIVCVLVGLDLSAAAQQPVAIDPQDARERLYGDIQAEFEAIRRQRSLLKKVIQFVRPSVVHVESRKSADRTGLDRDVAEAGAGVIIKRRNSFYVLTNWHVIRNSAKSDIVVALPDGRRLQPTRIEKDEITDIAVMRIAATRLVSAQLGDSQATEIGDFVLAFGSPFGLNHSVTFGIISAKNRRDLTLGSEVELQDFLQTDAAINPGNSGGPLLNLRGEVIGINTAIASSSGGSEGIGFAIPLRLANEVAEQLIDHGNVTRAFLGVHLDGSYDGEAARELGLLSPGGARVKLVTEDSAAANAELRPDDVIIQFDGVKIEDDNHLINQVKLTPVDASVEVVVLRNSRRIVIQVQMGARNE